jgi:hypothetical protein
LARFNEILAPRFNRFLTKMLSMKGGAPSPQLSGDIIPVLPVEEISVESRFHAGWNRFSVGITIGGVVAQTNAVQIRNPRGSNVIAVVEELSFFSASAGNEVDLQAIIGSSAAQDVDLAVVNNGIPLDARNPGVSGVCKISSGNNVAGGAVAARYQNPVNAVAHTMRTANHQLVLAPGTIYFVLQGITNTALTVNFIWRERFLEESERAN